MTRTYITNIPTVGGDDNTWGTETNANWELVDDLFDGTTGITPNLISGWEVGGTAVTATAAELNVLDGVTASTAELNILDGVTASTAELNILDGVTSTAAELNILDGVTATTSELNYVDGVTSNIQTQFTAKANLDSPALTGTPTAPTATAGTDTTQIATTAFVKAEIANDVAVRSAYVSSDQTITSGGLLTLAHGLGEAPKLVQLHLVCAVAQGGWDVGDVIMVGNNQSTSGDNRHTSAYFDATNVYVRFTDSGAAFTVAFKTTGVAVNLTNTSWRLRVRAFA